ncbi:hypothetical protein CHS0354_026113 [Potamilus streckersoni]|uniref:Uncharacterized protein n=1 Tax=Potamilus streckersoni TaxID=2493646 RepID=A0AAE0VMN5_9BIVA|nr:hypothetical protein CHS0354_026113 [Potamilus streckersoni]
MTSGILMLVMNETVYGDVPVDSEARIIFEIVATGSTRGKVKLISSAGFNFVAKLELKKETIEWRCSESGKNA